MKKNLHLAIQSNAKNIIINVNLENLDFYILNNGTAINHKDLIMFSEKGF